MVAAMMESEEKERARKTTLKVDTPEGELVGKIAKLRGVSVEVLFKQKDLNDFLAHLYMEELRKESERMKRAQKGDKK